MCKIPMERIGDINYKLQAILKNLKKSPNRIYSEEYIKATTELVQKLKQECESFQASPSSLFDQIGVNSVTSECYGIANIILKFLQPKAVDPKNNTEEIQMASISLRDVEDALGQFDGENKPVADWLEDFEDAATTCKWDGAQKYIFCRKLLVGTARFAITARDTIKDYDTLKAFLVTEFAAEDNSASVHETLRKMRQQRGESQVQFAYRLQAFALRAKVDEKSIIRYVVHGLCNEAKRELLIESTNFAELRRKLVAHESMISDEVKVTARPGGLGGRVSSSDHTRPQVRIKQESVSSIRKCFQCDQPGHLARDCRQKGVSCYQCGQTGHLSRDCQRKEVTCYRCGQKGHIAPACKENTSAGPSKEKI